MEKKETLINNDIRNKLNELGKFYGDIMADIFIDDISIQVSERNIKSPIEQLLFFGLKFIINTQSIDIAEPMLCYKTNENYLRGIDIDFQYKIGKYFIDFIITKYSFINYKQEKEIILIECDSQEWHERTEEQRRYEKERDRYIQKQGYKIFHYTGKEIIQNPIKIAKEILLTLGEEIND